MITTKTGDDGKSRFGGKVVDKDSALLEAIGSIDELMAVLGIIMSLVTSHWSLGKKIEKINKNLYQISGFLAGFNKITNVKLLITNLEEEIKKEEKKRGTIEKFLKAGDELDVWLNWARTVCRRTERRVVTLKASKDILIYFNRLSDYLFLLAIK